MILDPLGDGISELELIQSVGSDKMIVNAARVSYANDVLSDKEFNAKDAKLLRFLIENRHETPLEHTLITYRIKAPLYVVQEMLRHRIGVSINQESGRYVELSKQELRVERKFYVPQEFRAQDKKNKQSSILQEDAPDGWRETYLESCTNSFEQYNKLIEMGIARELARGVLPHSTYTSLYYTLNMRSLIHFLGLRLPDNAQLEIRRYAKGMLDLVQPYFPETINIVGDRFSKWTQKL